MEQRCVPGNAVEFATSPARELAATERWRGPVQPVAVADPGRAPDKI